MKHLLGLNGVSASEIQEILDEAFRMKKEVLQGSKKDSCLSGKSIITLFYENSTRTRLSFELASKYLGATAANIAASSSSVAKGETLIDTAKTIDSMAADVIIIRHSSSGAPHLIAKHTNASVVNAGDGMHEHPTQALLDLMTMKENKGDLKGLRVAIVGDVKHSRVARSNIYGLHTMGADVVLGGPTTLMPAEVEAMGVPVYTDMLQKAKTPEEIHKMFSEFYAGQKFVKVMPLDAEAGEGNMLAGNGCSGWDGLKIFITGNEDRVVLSSQFDNLGKGASGAAIQCLNIVMGCEEDKGLQL